jgi:methylated-DNA-[protein]-cysteine S-methyltransferase
MLKNKVYELCKKIPKGKITTYGEIGKALNTKAYRAIGQILRCNPNAPITPCHRVISSSGSIGGFKGKISGKEIKEKISLLNKEGIQVKNNKIENFKKVLFRF